MDAALRELSDQIDQATQRLLDRARIITEPDLRAPSLLPGWTRAHVLAHVARNADAMRNILVGVRTGQDRPGYTSAGSREAGIEQDAGRPARELTADLADSAMALRTVARQLPGSGRPGRHGAGGRGGLSSAVTGWLSRSWRQVRIGSPSSMTAKAAGHPVGPYPAPRSP